MTRADYDYQINAWNSWYDRERENEAFRLEIRMKAAQNAQEDAQMAARQMYDDRIKNLNEAQSKKILSIKDKYEKSRGADKNNKK